MNTSSNQFEDPREIIHRKHKEGLGPLKDAIMEKATLMLQHEERGGDVLTNLQSLLDRIQQDDDISVTRARYSGMFRYLFEQGGYTADTVQLDYLLKSGQLKKGDTLLDLGTGSGEVVKKWAQRGNTAIGLDASPSFVAASELLKLGLIDDEMEHLQKILPVMAENRTILTSLTLDRVARPRQLLTNTVHLAGPKGKFAVASLFPIIAEDDEKGLAHPIVYTPYQHRITNTGTERGDLQNVTELLQDISGKKITSRQVDYIVRTNSGTQVYDKYYILTSAE